MVPKPKKAFANRVPQNYLTALRIFPKSQKHFSQTVTAKATQQKKKSPRGKPKKRQPSPDMP